jgi:RNA polymerase sigma-54 factor
LKYFFTNAIKKKDGDVQSSESVREMIKEIIEENVGKKISDQKIADILQMRGIRIARRTVAKYRNILNILPSAKRNI